MRGIRVLLWLCAALAALLCAAGEGSASPVARQLPFSMATSLAPGTYVFRFSLWTSATGGEDPAWQEEKSVKLAGATLKTSLGTKVPLRPADFAQQLWVGVERRTAGGYAPVGPRVKLAVAPYALYSLAAAAAGAVPCIPGDFLNCYTGPPGTRGTGVCAPGVRTCGEEGFFGGCEGEVLPAGQDACAGADDDCNGVAGEGCACLVGDTLTCGIGACTVHVACSTGHETCVPLNPGVESCNGIDDDCDGVVDEGCLANGAPCAGGGQCASGYCVDGVCCDSACSGVCQACSAAKKGSGDNGLCGAIPALLDPDNECPGSGACGSACNGAGACGYPPLGADCGLCMTCDGAGSCLVNNSIHTDCGLCQMCSFGACLFQLVGWDLKDECFGGAGYCDGAGSCQ